MKIIMTKQEEFNNCLAFVHECGHALMMYILFEDSTVIDCIEAKPKCKPATYPSDRFFQKLDILNAKDHAYNYALCCLAGGALELLTISPDYRFIFKDLALIFWNSPYLPNNSIEARQRIYDGMDDDIKKLYEKYSNLCLEKPDIDGLFQKAINQLFGYFQANKENAGNVFNLIVELDTNYRVESKNPNGNIGLRMNGDRIVAYLQGWEI